DVRAALADRLERPVFARLEKLGHAVSQVEPACGDPHLDPAVRPVGDHLRGAGAPTVGRAPRRKQWLHRLEQSLPMREVDGAAIVRIDERQIPKLRALVEVGNTRRADLQRELGEGIDHAGSSYSLLKRHEGGKKALRAASAERLLDEG